jgi:DNA repair exonuclease SbcCD ATPase subunit
MAANKLVLKKLQAKNFRSIGNVFLEMDYTKAMTTLIASENNGSGKSNLAVWALYFVLFGKPYGKDCKIGGLVNSKSTKDCVVELEFTTLGHEWKVRRGYKPAIFEIYQKEDDEWKLIESEAAKSDYQAFLQSKIGMDEKAFENIVALGVERFVPFVSMKADERRKFVEQMLDMIVISQMNVNAKEATKLIRKEMEQLQYDIGLKESKHAGHVRTLQILETKKQQRVAETGSELEGFRAEVGKLTVMVNRANEKHEQVSDQIVPGAGLEVSKITQMIQKFRFKIDEIIRGSGAINNLHDCPTCKQGVTDGHKQLIKDATDAEVGKLREPMEKLQEKLLGAQAVVDKNTEVEAERKRISDLIFKLETQLQSAQNSIKTIEAKMVDTNEDDQIEAERKSMHEIGFIITELNGQMTSKLQEEREHLQLLQVLKDDGVKASIVAQYIPALNQAINKVLDQLNLYVQINIDSEFNVSMFAPDRKGQTLGNLSTGQLRRIDLAVLLAWRDIAKKKASVDCNVLILDEILENLSATGVEEFMDMWGLIGKETNLLVISQRAAEFETYFDRTIMYALKNDLTIEV